MSNECRSAEPARSEWIREMPQTAEQIIETSIAAGSSVTILKRPCRASPIGLLGGCLTNKPVAQTLCQAMTRLALSVIKLLLMNYYGKTSDSVVSVSCINLLPQLTSCTPAAPVES